MYCPNCGKSIKEYDNFCRYCGVNLREEEKEEIFSPTQIRKYVERTIRLYGIMIDLEETLKFIDNEFGKKVKEFQEELESFGIKLNCWDVENILKHYEITRFS